MNQTQYQELADKCKAGWPEDRITVKDEHTLLLECEEGGWIKVARMVVPEEDKAGFPAEMLAMFHDRLLIQYTENLDAPSYKNLGFYIHKGEMPKNPKMLEALKELTFRIQLGSALA